MKRTIIAAAALAVALAGPAAGQDRMVCGRDISFEPLSVQPFSTKPGEYTVRKSDIRRLSRPKINPKIGYVLIVPIEGDARKDGNYPLRLCRS